MKEWVKKPTTQAGVLVALAFVLTLSIALLADIAETAVLLLLTVLAGVFQFLGAARFHEAGRADPSLARASVRRLLALGIRARTAKQAAEVAYEQATPTEAKKVAGILSSELSFIEESALQAVQDWREFHSDALTEIKEGTSD